MFNRPSLASDKLTNGFLSVYPEVVKTVFESELFQQVPEHNRHFESVLNYNVIKEKRLRYPILLETYETLEKKENLTEKNLHLANILGWCLELISAYMTISDDLMAQNESRGEDICWYKKETIGLNAINDAVFAYEAAFIVLRRYFLENPIYLPLYHLLRESHVSFIIGQTMDWKIRAKVNPDFSNFNTTNYMTLGRYQEGFSNIEAPFEAACILSQRKDYEKIQDIITEIGYLNQIDTDISGVFEKGKPTNKVVNNIRKGQCTWMAVQVLEHGSSDVINTFAKNYGQAKPECEKQIIDIYMQMNLYEKYVEHKRKVFEEVHRCVKQINDLSMQQAILNLCEKMQ